MNILILEILLKVIQLYTYLLVIYALLSWFPGAYDSALGRFISSIVEPLIAPFRRLNLQFAGLDFTIWAVVIVLNVLTRLLAYILL
ncbi:MAG: YggT family protein [Streptococcus orisratti]|uniref:YggT family protein n=1 Tax=Streptococcus orisratti TaxID=114652 RepID=UPI0023548FA6|nr:YggT family protein [Streptococcus orisratti]MCI7677469.1 YggT family protein [Streptococcus orisratti]MDY4001351.1 YggT family protein [Streptococcus orisratti]